ncbi:hypothetical protein SERLA73DRAFT_183605 [Serpula lacrymans var. lacrymans S7.3]|uniref:DUF323 domain-containing protein n=2 Tax=Serpula lacrymans var. lacrymans TaxID=341189 RepID=F8Q072_SERL3|nr:uncharacterized protein SERLADRAFT_470869 [Serpula lacrymans var. lacrymans S7.9]EGN98544.1 hypothetical protein SERLA73DRAFT_183605 [Serpula lacrymans var. lacrymans S7.3]EGO24113.1 hypothetical protein SERLADRAFT_470869 [Serpula lacrymans var. lacrymans S7.9]
MSNVPHIVDVRFDVKNHCDVKDTSYDIVNEIISGISQPSGQRRLPTLLLYDERGLKLYDDITTEAPEYYLFGAEEEILANNADDIIGAMHRAAGEVVPGEVVLELGAGALRKTSHILAGLSRTVSASTVPAPITYYALDLEKRELERTLDQLANSDVGAALSGKVDIKGMLGTYDGGLKFVEDGGLHGSEALDNPSVSNLIHSAVSRPSRDASPSSLSSNSTRARTTETGVTTPSTPGNSQPPLHVMFLGSSLGNFTRPEAAEFLRSLPLRSGSGDTLLLGLDHDNEPREIEEAYNDPKGYTKAFIMNGLQAAGAALGDANAFDETKWEYVNTYNRGERRHEAFYKCKVAHSIHIPSMKLEVIFSENEMVQIERSLKFSETDVHSLFTAAQLRPIQRWMDSSSRYSLWLLERPPFMFPLLPSPSAEQGKFGVPATKDWQNLWSAWDFVTLQMIPPAMLFQKPIDLRHICLFYIGHIPTFLDIHLSRLLGEAHTEPIEYKDIFERGIDPNVDDPGQCHPHSEVPDREEDWPSLNSMLLFRDRVRDRLMKLYADVDAGTIQMTRKIARVLCMTHEHEGFHIETLLYMLLQRAGTGTIPPPEFTPPSWDSLAVSWNSAEEPLNPVVTVGPSVVTLRIDDVEADDNDPVKSKEVLGHDFGWDNESPPQQVHVDAFRIEWRPVTNGQFYEFYNSDNRKDKVQLPASWVECEDGTYVRTLYGPIPMKVAWKWPVMTSYDNLSAYASVKGGRIPTEPELRTFLDKFESGYEGGSNVGFRNWHPIPATTGGTRNGGMGHNGGVWEWTSTIFDRYDGFVPSKLYPGYSADFFDECHQVVIGGSHATIPRIAERHSVRNWYQRNYPYPWVGARVAYDITE